MNEENLPSGNLPEGNYVDVASVDVRVFVKQLLELGAKGAILEDTQVARKGILLSARLTLPQEQVVEESPNTRVVAKSTKSAKGNKGGLNANSSTE